MWILFLFGPSAKVYQSKMKPCTQSFLPRVIHANLKYKLKYKSYNISWKFTPIVNIFLQVSNLETEQKGKIDPVFFSIKTKIQVYFTQNV